MKESLYSRRSNLVIGFHGCDKSVAEAVIAGNSDLLIRKLDCAVVQTAKKINAKANSHSYDSVKGVFWEGHELYPNAGFREKNHIQICVCNPNCVKGYFLPRGFNHDYPNP